MIWWYYHRKTWTTQTGGRYGSHSKNTGEIYLSAKVPDQANKFVFLYRQSLSGIKLPVYANVFQLY